MTLFEAPAVHESNHYSNPYSHPYSNPEYEDEWEVPEISHYNNLYSNPELEADQFFFLAPLAAKIGAKIAGKLALKGAKKLAFKGAKKMISRAPKVLNRVQQISNRIQQIRRNLPQQNSSGRKMQPQSQAPSWLPQARSLVGQLSNLLREGESEAEALEAEFFGNNEFEGELANHAAAHEIALTELLATEAAQTESEAEAEALLRRALPIAIRVMSGETLRQASPFLMQANRRLVRSLHQQGSDGREFLRVVSAIHRRTIASLRVIRTRGGQITPELVSQLMLAHTERVLGTPSILGRALVRNFAIRRATPIPVRELI
jgi:hypothetical protein